jgi:hypothetical protein
MEVIYTTKGDSPGYTRYFLAEPVGQGQAGVKLTGDTMKLHEPQKDILGNEVTEMEYSIILHGVREFEVPNEIKSLKSDDGKTLKLDKS